MLLRLSIYAAFRLFYQICGEPNIDTVTWECPARLCTDLKCIRQLSVVQLVVHFVRSVFTRIATTRYQAYI